MRAPCLTPGHPSGRATMRPAEPRRRADRRQGRVVGPGVGLGEPGRDAGRAERDDARADDQREKAEPVVADVPALDAEVRLHPGVAQRLVRLLLLGLRRHGLEFFRRFSHQASQVKRAGNRACAFARLRHHALEQRRILDRADAVADAVGAEDVERLGHPDRGSRLAGVDRDLGGALAGAGQMGAYLNEKIQGGQPVATPSASPAKAGEKTSGGCPFSAMVAEMAGWKNAKANRASRVSVAGSNVFMVRGSSQ